MSSNNSPENPYSGAESPLITVGSPVESLLYPQKRSIWGERIVENDELAIAAGMRIELSEYLASLFEILPITLEVTDAYDRGIVKVEELCDLFEKLSYFLDSRDGNEVLALYLPFELIPRSNWQPDSARLKIAATAFTDSYLGAWISLLSRKDPRADFADGDIPEFEVRTGPLPEVVKVAHLIPVLVEKGIIPPPEDATFETDEVLSRSVREGLRALARSPSKKAPEGVRDAKWLSLSLSLASIDVNSIRSEPTSSVPPARAKWQAKRGLEKTLDRYSDEIAHAICSRSISLGDLAALAETYPDDEIQALAIKAGSKALCMVARIDVEEARRMYLDFEEFMEFNWHHKAPFQPLETAWSHLSALGVVSDEVLRERGILSPDLVEGSCGNTAKMEAIVRMIKTHPKLQGILPVVLAYGSKVKGYGSRDSDDDFAVFIAPGTSFSSRSELKRTLSEALRGIDVRETPMEFWLTEFNGEVRIRDHPDPDRHLGNSALCPTLFNSVWTGDPAVIEKLHQRLLSGYLFAKGTTYFGESARKVWLRDMEQTLLQYRLMHLGYHRFYPEARAAYVPDSDDIDSKSAFWDSGYRRVATMIFLKKLFLPRL